MRTIVEIEKLLEELDKSPADELEDQDLDFKEWDTKSIKESIHLVVKMAVCMANGGGGTVVFGVNDKSIGREKAILGVPHEIDINNLKKAVYDSTDPKITPVFEEISVAEGTGRILVMQVYPGLPPYTDSSGKGTIRIGKDCQPLTGTMRRKITVETGENDYTAEEIKGDWKVYISPSAMEILREIAGAEKAPGDLISQSNPDLFSNLKLIPEGKLSRAGLILGGSEEVIHRLMPGYVWTFLRMESDTDYSFREDRTLSLPASIKRIEEMIKTYNPITTIRKGMHDFEYRTYPEVAVREVLMNAFCHRDYRSPGPIMIKSYKDRLEITNTGSFIGGITPDNILHHPPIPRNPLLVQALISLRLVNRNNLGISRIYNAFLIEGKEVPFIEEIGESVQVTFLAQETSPAFREFIQHQSESGRIFKVDELILIRFLLYHHEIDMATAIRICQRNETQIRITLDTLEREEVFERGGVGHSTYWSISPSLHRQLSDSGDMEHHRRIERDAAKTRILSILIERARRGEPGLSNSDIRRITHYDRNQVYILMKELKKEESRIIGPGKGHTATYKYYNNPE